MKAVVIIISVLSAVVAIYPIIFEGALKKRSKNEPKGKMFKAEFSKVNRFGWGLVFAIVSFNFFNGLISYKSIDENDKKQKAIEFEKENIFTHLQDEVDNNLQKLIFVYDSVKVMQFADTNMFTILKLSDLYTTKYTSISDQRIIIRWLIQTSEALNIVNKHIDYINANALTPKDKKIAIELFLQSVRTAKKYLYPIFEKIYKLNSYKEYESIDFTKESTKINYDSLNFYIFRSALNRPDVEYIPSKDTSLFDVY